MIARISLATALLLAGCAGSRRDPQADQAAIRALVDAYARSIDAASPEIAAQVWLQSEDASFIHPRGQEIGWKAIAQNFYGKTMGQTFSRRQLTPRDVAISQFGDAAVALFHWEFNATRRKDGAEIRTQGRETQVYVRQNGQWALVHVHYSGPPRTAPGEGF